jgi:3D (Asp-Asp-Asp) domain-containing protein
MLSRGQHNFSKERDSIGLLTLLTAGVIVLPGVGAIFPSDIPEAGAPAPAPVEAEAPEPVSETYEENTRDFVLTAYTADCPGCSGITYAGLDVRDTIYTPAGLRVVAIDPDVIPIGSVVRIEFNDGRAIKAKASDIGGAIDGKDIDLLVGSRDKALRIGRQAVEVEVLREGGE